MGKLPKECRSADGSKLPRDRCSVCNYEMDAATCVEKGKRRRPKPGDISLCLRCGEVYQYNSKMKLELCKISALLELSQEQHDLIRRGQLLIRKIRK